MARGIRKISKLALVLSLGLFLLPAKAASLAEQTLIICNADDPDSRQLAEYYAARRSIPETRIVALHCPLTEEIGRAEYDALIAGPLRERFAAEQWWSYSTAPSESGKIVSNKIRFVALIRGMPLKIRAEAAYPGDVPGTREPGTRNEASLDSELARLAFQTRQISGPADNPYYRQYDRLENVALPEMLLVCRLDGPTPDDVHRIIDDSLRAEQDGLFGWAVLDTRSIESAGYKEGDDWISGGGEKLRAAGFPTFADRAEPILPAGLPLPETAFYLGWYAGDWSGALAGPSFRFAPGAVACHIHSYSATTLRSPVTGWCGPLVSHGAAAVLGNVYEPYLVLTAHLDIFTDRLLRGFTFAEAAWASLPGTSWMSVNVGDPLYRPFASAPNSGKAGGRGPKDLLRLYARSFQRKLVDYSNGFMAEAWAQEKLAEGDNDAAAVLFEAALQQDESSADVARVTWSYGQMLIAAGKKWQAVALVRKINQRLDQRKDGSPFLAAWQAELDPPPPTPAPSPR